MLGGEALSGALVSRIQSALPGVEVVNMYGPTEACIDATYHVATDADLAAAVLPIGRPLSNYHAYVLDRRLEARWRRRDWRTLSWAARVWREVT